MVLPTTIYSLNYLILIYVVPVPWDLEIPRNKERKGKL